MCSIKYNACYKADMIRRSDPTAQTSGRDIPSDRLRARDERSILIGHDVSLITDFAACSRCGHSVGEERIGLHPSCQKVMTHLPSGLHQRRS